MEIQQEIHRDDYIVTTEIEVGTSVKIKMLDQDAKQQLDPRGLLLFKRF